MEDQLVFEVFELSPLNKHVIETKGRLTRQFPASAVAMPLYKIQKHGFVASFAHAISKMSTQTPASSYEVSYKAGRSHLEIRDTVNPRMVTHYLVAVLDAFGHPATMATVWKNTREDALWSDCLHPWHRSPLWLMLRVALHLQLDRVTSNKGQSLDLYKVFMIFLHSNILDRALRFDMSSSLYRVMIAKISQRLLKLDIKPHCGWVTEIEEILVKAHKIATNRWKRIMDISQPSIDLSGLSMLKPSEDIHIQLPKLDRFIKGLTLRENSRTSSVPDCARFLDDTPKRQPPLEFKNSTTAYPIHALAAFESWVEEDLQYWKANAGTRLSTCKLLNDMIREYHKSASRHYAKNPESFSIMILTILELWKTSDALSLEEYPMLQEYDSEIAPEMLQCLILPLAQQMRRLRVVEQYLGKRRADHTESLPSVFRDFGETYSFATRYFEQSQSHHDLRLTIEKAAEKEKQTKLKELRLKKSSYDDLMLLYDQSSCDYDQTVLDESNDIYERQHSQDCQRCNYRIKAKSIQIKIHEWPLSGDEDVAKATVFELNVPVLFQEWRNITVYLLIDVLLLKYGETRESNSNVRYNLCKDIGLRHHRTSSWTDAFCINVVSAVKPVSVSHYATKAIHLGLSENNVCVDNGLHYQYYDGTRASFISQFRESLRLLESCRYVLPGRSKNLQRFLVKSHKNPNDVVPNEVIASQCDCPDHMSLDEFRAFASMPLGYRVQWHNILTQLAMPSVDFAKQETSIMFSQVIYQAGPSSFDDYRRDAHEVVANEKMANAIFKQLYKNLERVKESWQSKWALQNYIQLARRCLSLGSCEKQCIDFLGVARETAYQWFRTLHRRRQDSVDLAYRKDVLTHQVEVALVCIDTLNVDSCYFENILQYSDAIAKYIHCSIVVQENSMVITECSTFTSILYQRWQKFAFKISEKINNLVVGEVHPCLDEAIERYWPVYQRSEKWQQCKRPQSHWLMKILLTDDASVQMVVHFDLLSANLLVDGLPVSRLPGNYTSQSTYTTLFGLHSLDVMPSSIRGMAFTAKEKWHGYTISFGTPSANDEDKLGSGRLWVFAEREGQRYDFVPCSVFEDHLPLIFVEEFAHWYHHETHSVILTPRKQPWSLSLSVWRVSKLHLTWNVTGEDGILINPGSQTASITSSILSSLEDPNRIHLILSGSSDSTIVHLPRLQLEFLFEPGTATLESKEFRKFSVDAQQAIGTLVGLQNKLTLRHKYSGKRMVLVPHAKVSFSKASQHVRVSIAHSVAKVFHYRIDEDLGRLLDSGDLRSKLWLAYLHALSSYCYPDSLTGFTGTEQAINILRSAAVRSFQKFDAQSLGILKLIAEIAPTRNYYPPYAKVMQEVTWKAELDFMTQDSLLIPAVQTIFKQITDQSMFQGGSFIPPPSLEFGSDELLARDLHRSSVYRVCGFGKEYFQLDADRVYPARDRLPRSERGHCVYDTTYFISQNNSEMFIEPSPQLRDYLWSIFQQNGPVLGSLTALITGDLSYDAEWLDNPLGLLIPAWYSVIVLIRSMRQQGEVFQFIFWLTCLAFEKNVDKQMVQLLASSYNLEDVCSIVWPKAFRFELKLGRELRISVLEDIIKAAAKPFAVSVEANLPAVQGDTSDTLSSRRKQLFDDALSSATRTLLARLSAQWPCEIPASTYDEAVMLYIEVDKAMVEIRNRFKEWHCNLRFYHYLYAIEKSIKSHKVKIFSTRKQVPLSIKHVQPHRRRFVHTRDLFEAMSTACLPAAPSNSLKLLNPTQVSTMPNLKLPVLIDKLEKQSRTAADADYVKDLIASMASLRDLKNDVLKIELETTEWTKLLLDYLNECSSYVKDLYEFITCKAITVAPIFKLLCSISQGPRMSPMILLQRLLSQHWVPLGQRWRETIIQYGLAFTELHRARRLLKCEFGTAEFITELLNAGHSNWSPWEFPESLLLEIDSGIMIRAKQEEIALCMRKPPDDRNTTMQLNMGEGKSSVIIPHIAASLANGSALLRVIVGRPQSKQMFAMLSSKLSGILDRRIYHLPFSRDIVLSSEDARRIKEICEECKEHKGILLVQPEHLLSLKLMSIERFLAKDYEVAESLLQAQRYLEKTSRDIVDECDEHFNVTFELVYTIGVQKPIDFSPHRWCIVMEMLEHYHQSVLQIQKIRPNSVEIDNTRKGRYPRFRLLDPEVHEAINIQIARHICSHGMSELPIAQQPEYIREAAFKYMTQASLTTEDQVAISTEQGGFWTESKRQAILLLRGLLAGGVLAFAFGLKRWRVSYGLDAMRVPVTKLAIPFRAKDNPSPRSEFSHTEVILVLTGLSYLYGGMTDEDIFISIQHLLKSDQAASKYQDWVRTAPELPSGFRQLSGLNSEDRVQCIEFVFPHLRYSKGLIDFFLSHIVFPKYMRETPSKLSVSGWDIGEPKDMPLTGFSGTNDSRHVLPLEVDYLEIAEQTHTNALVLECLLQDLNKVHLLPPLGYLGQSETVQFLEIIITLKPQLRVVLDVGAQLIDLNNLQVARSWLRLLNTCQDVEAAVFVDDYHELMVVDRNNRCTPLQSSPYADKLDACIVYLDEIHTRGIDLVLPIDYRAAVTLGSGLTKDRLVQGKLPITFVHEHGG